MSPDGSASHLPHSYLHFAEQLLDLASDPKQAPPVAHRLAANLTAVAGPEVVELLSGACHALVQGHALPDAGAVSAEAVDDQRALPSCGRAQTQDLALGMPRTAPCIVYRWAFFRCSCTLLASLPTAFTAARN